MYLVKNEKIEVKLNIYIKIYADNSTLKHKNKSKIISNRTSRLLFLRSPKHFKTGKQILKKKRTILQFNCNFKNINSIWILYENNLFNFFKNNLFNYTFSDSEIYKITLKNKIKIIL